VVGGVEMGRGEVDVVVHGEFGLARDIEIFVGEKGNVSNPRKSLRLFSSRFIKTFSSEIVGMKYLVIAQSCRLCVCYLILQWVCGCRYEYVTVLWAIFVFST
jgi:hypothetical protein